MHDDCEFCCLVRNLLREFGGWLIGLAASLAIGGGFAFGLLYLAKYFGLDRLGAGIDIDLEAWAVRCFGAGPVNVASWLLALLVLGGSAVLVVVACVESLPGWWRLMRTCRLETAQARQLKAQAAWAAPPVAVPPLPVNNPVPAWLNNGPLPAPEWIKPPPLPASDPAPPAGGFGAEIFGGSPAPVPVMVPRERALPVSEWPPQLTGPMPPPLRMPMPPPLPVTRKR